MIIYYIRRGRWNKKNYVKLRTYTEVLGIRLDLFHLDLSIEFQITRNSSTSESGMHLQRKVSILKYTIVHKMQYIIIQIVFVFLKFDK